MPESSNKIRCFISLPLPESIIDEMAEIQSILKSGDFFYGKFTARANIHLTLKFLGEIDNSTIENVNQRLQQIRFQPVNVKLGEPGVFSKRDIRIVWMHLQGVNDIQAKVDNTLKDLFEKERRFMSHITMARVKKLRDRNGLLQFLNEVDYKSETQTVDHFILKKSTLTPKGPIYENLYTYRAIS